MLDHILTTGGGLAGLLTTTTRQKNTTTHTVASTASDSTLGSAVNAGHQDQNSRRTLRRSHAFRGPNFGADAKSVRFSTVFTDCPGLELGIFSESEDEEDAEEDSELDSPATPSPPVTPSDVDTIDDHLARLSLRKAAFDEAEKFRPSQVFHPDLSIISEVSSTAYSAVSSLNNAVPPHPLVLTKAIRQIGRAHV